MDLASVAAALASVGVRVSGSAPNSNVQVDSSCVCPPGLAGPEPSGTINDPGQHFHCHSCPALHRRTGPLALCDNHSLAEGHWFFTDHCLLSTALTLSVKEGPYQDRPPLCPFRLLPLPTCS